MANWVSIVDGHAQSPREDLFWFLLHLFLMPLHQLDKNWQVCRGVMGEKLWHVRMLDLPPASYAETVGVHSELFSSDNSWYPDSPRMIPRTPTTVWHFPFPWDRPWFEANHNIRHTFSARHRPFINSPNKVIRPAKQQNLTCWSLLFSLHPCMFSWCLRFLLSLPRNSQSFSFTVAQCR